MSSKRIFSLRLNEDVREALLEVADTQSTTVTALINRYILQGLAQDKNVGSTVSIVDSGARVIKPENTSISAAEERIEELLFQVLLNQRNLIDLSRKNQDYLTNMSGNLSESRP